VGEHDLGEVYAGSYRRLVVRLYAITTDLAEAEEVVQEAFVRVLASPRRLRDVDSPEAWLFRTAVNLARTRARRRLVLDRVLRRVGEPPVVPDTSDDHVALIAALRGLPAGQRYALALHYLLDLPIEEVAEVLGVSVGTVKSRLHRGRAALAGAFRGDLTRVGGDHA